MAQGASGEAQQPCGLRDAAGFSHRVKDMEAMRFNGDVSVGSVRHGALIKWQAARHANAVPIHALKS